MGLRSHTDGGVSRDRDLGLQAADWLLRLNSREFDPQEPYPDLAARNAAFVEWIRQSRDHLRVFLDTFEVHRRLHAFDQERSIKLDEMLASNGVVNLFTAKENAGTRPALKRRPTKRWAVAAVFAAAACASLFFFLDSANRSYATSIGEQHTEKLSDGSFVTLNADSRIAVDFSGHARNILLVRGEALFQVAHDPTRPFWVRTQTAAVRAVGTQFNVRRLIDNSTEVAVVEGVVQVNATTAGIAAPASDGSPTAVAEEAAVQKSSSIRLAAGEEAQVSAGKVQKSDRPSIESALAWRQRRLVFHNTQLREIAAEFNRFNLSQIVVEGPAAEKRLTGIFDADRPEALIMYATKEQELLVQREGSNWVISAR